MAPGHVNTAAASPNISTRAGNEPSRSLKLHNLMIFSSATQFHVYHGLNACLAFLILKCGRCSSQCQPEEGPSLVGDFSMIVNLQSSRRFISSSSIYGECNTGGGNLVGTWGTNAGLLESSKGTGKVIQGHFWILSNNRHL